jgi:4'-phosphopantetheinyl transferase
MNGLPRVYWRLANRDTLGISQSRSWWPRLCSAERQVLGRFSIERRRDDWLLGRLTVKALLGDVITGRAGVRPAAQGIFIDREPSGAPLARVAPEGPMLAGHRSGAPLPVAISISHAGGHALGGACWLDEEHAAAASIGLGVDLEQVSSRSQAFVSDFFTDRERDWCAAADPEQRDVRVNLVWSAKEALLKALGVGLSADTRTVECLPVGALHRSPMMLIPDAPAWSPLLLSCRPGLLADSEQVAGMWCRLSDFVATAVVVTRRRQTSSCARTDRGRSPGAAGARTAC